MAQSRDASGSRRTEATRARERYWRRIFEEQRSSDLTHTAFCKKKSISINAYFWWKRELPHRDERRRKAAAGGRGKRGTKVPAPSLVPVRIKSPVFAQVTGDAPVFEVVLRGDRVLRVPAGFDAEELRRLVAVLEGERC